MSKHRHHDECCYPMMGYGMGSYGLGGAFGGYGTAGTGYGYGAGGGIRWIYALLILIVIVLQFGRRREFCNNVVSTECGEVASSGCGLLNNNCNNQLIDNSVLFIIVVFLLILCAGCWGGSSGAGYGFGGFGGGYGY